MERLAKTLLLLLLLPSLAWGATKIFSENFDDQPSKSGIYPFIYRIYGAEATASDYQWVTGRGGSGYALANVSAPVWIEWSTDFGGNDPGDWSTNEIYGSSWFYLPNEFSGNIYKYMYWNFGVEDKIEVDLNGTTSLFIETYDNSAYVHSSWPSATVSSGTWHHVEIYINFSTHVVRVWYDRPAGDYTSEATTTTVGTYLKYYRVISGWDSNHMDTIGFGCFQNGGGTLARYIDDIELWDGIPDEESPSTPTITNGGFRNGGIR